MKKGYLYILLSTILFSTMEIALKVVTGKFNPIQLTFLRFLIGSILLMPLSFSNLKRKNIKLDKNDIKFFAFSGFICVVVSMTLYQLAVINTQASIVAILFSCNPVFVLLFAYFILKEKIYNYTIISTIVSILGILVIMNPLHVHGGLLGIILTILAAVTFALYGVIGKTRSNKFGGTVVTCFSFLLGSIEMFILIILTKINVIASLFTNAGLKEFANIPILRGIDLQSLPELIYIGIFVTGLGYTFYFLAMEKTSAATASIVFFIKPALAPLLALLLIKEPITLSMLLGIILIITGSLISFISGMKAANNIDKEKEININKTSTQS